MSEATASTTRSEPSPIRFWVPGDLNAFFGLGSGRDALASISPLLNG